MSKRDIPLLLEHMIESAFRIKNYTKDLDLDSFIKDEKTVDAVVRYFEIIGEAANRIDPKFRQNNSDVEWERIRGLRNRIVHDYFGIDFKIVWSIIEDDLDKLITQLNSLKSIYSGLTSDE